MSVGARAHRVAVVCVGTVLTAWAVAVCSAPGAPVVVWPLAANAGAVLGAAGVASLVAIVASSVAARRGFPQWSGLGGLGVLCLALCTGCLGIDHAVSMGSLDDHGTRIGDVVWRTARVPMDSYTVGALYRCDRFGVICTRCPDRSEATSLGPIGGVEIPEAEICP